MEDFRGYFAGKAAAVTGGASGVGLALAEEMLSYGADKVVLADFDRAHLAEQAARLDALHSGRVRGIHCDVTRQEDVKGMIAEASDFFGGRLDILVNCAGAGFAGLFVDAGDVSPEGLEKLHVRVQTDADWEKAFALNFYGPLYGCRAAIPIMLEQGSGQIVNIISGIAFSPMPYQTMYSATKAALHALTLSLRAEFAEHNIRINSATPGTTATAIWGEDAPPDFAQTPQQSAQRVLEGVARNDRIILGDDNDLEAARHCFAPEAQDGIDEYMSLVAKTRRSGEGFLPTPDKS